jgi:hypothetical protein
MEIAKVSAVIGMSWATRAPPHLATDAMVAKPAASEIDISHPIATSENPSPSRITGT